MKKYGLYILAAVLVIVMIVGIIAAVCFFDFLKPGVHSFGGYTRLDFQEKVYFINADNYEVSGSSNVTVCGLVQPEDSSGASKSFRGSMSVAQYPLSLEDSYITFTAAASDGVISVTSLHADEFTQVPVTYWLHMSEDDPDIYAVYIHLEDGTSVVAYPGQDEQDAIANCKAYWKWFPGD